MADRGGEFRFFQGIHVRIDITIDILISIKPIIAKFGKQLHLQDLAQMRLIKQLLVTLSHQYHVTKLKHISTIGVSMVT